MKAGIEYDQTHYREVGSVADATGPLADGETVAVQIDFRAQPFMELLLHLSSVGVPVEDLTNLLTERDDQLIQLFVENIKKGTEDSA